MIGGRGGYSVEEQDKDDVQRWTTNRRGALVLSIVTRETKIREAASIFSAPWSSQMYWAWPFERENVGGSWGLVLEDGW
jgi:hypothetical protein